MTGSCPCGGFFTIAINDDALYIKHAPPMDKEDRYLAEATWPAGELRRHPDGCAIRLDRDGNLTGGLAYGWIVEDVHRA
jgi:hypothetical protein